MPYAFKTGRITISTSTPTKILDGFEAPEGVEVTLKPIGPNAVYIGNDDVTVANGLSLNGLQMPIKLSSYGPADLYAIASTGSTGTSMDVVYFVHQTQEVPCV